MASKASFYWCKYLVITVLTLSSAIIAFPAFAALNNEGIQTYQKNLPPEHKQKLADDITRYRNAANLWDVLREDFTLPHYEENPAVQERIEWFMNNQDFLLRAALRAAPYLYYISQQTKKRHLPAELVLLPIIESGYNPFAVSHVGATGIWQLMPATANGLGVKQDWWYDGRRDVITSTRGALNHLAYLQTFFDGNWLLAIAAYNTGEGNVMSAIRRNIRDGRNTDFWSLPIAQETRDYVPSLLALAIIISNPDQYPVYFPPVRNAPYLAQVEIGAQISLKDAAELAGISYKNMLQLNPGFNRSAAKKQHKLVLPIETIERFTENFAHTPLKEQIDWLHYRVKSGDTLASIAKKHGTSIQSIRKLNHLTKNSVRRGTNLLIPSNRDDEIQTITKSTKKVVVTKKKFTQTIRDAFSHLKKPSTPYKLQPGDTIYMVRDHDTPSSIAKRFHISTALLSSANDFSNKKLKPGMQIIIPTHPTYTQNSTEVEPLAAGSTVYLVKRGDTINKIAHKFKTTASAIRLANFVDDTSLSEGDKIIIPPRLRS